MAYHTTDFVYGINKRDAFSFDAFCELATWFHASPTAGLLLGWVMVEEAKKHVAQETAYNALCETSRSLPDAVQLLTPCTVGNGGLYIRDTGVYALSLFEQQTGAGVRVRLDPSKLSDFPHTLCWLLRKNPGSEQDFDALHCEIREHGFKMISVATVVVKTGSLLQSNAGQISLCAMCGSAFFDTLGGICAYCRGDSPYQSPSACVASQPLTFHSQVSLGTSHGEDKGHVTTRLNQERSKRCGESRYPLVTTDEQSRVGKVGCVSSGVTRDVPHGHVHVDDAVRTFVKSMSGPGVGHEEVPCEGRVNLIAQKDGVLVVNDGMLRAFNSLPNVIAASRREYSLVCKGGRIAAARVVSFHLEQAIYGRALAILGGQPLFSVLPMHKTQVGVLLSQNGNCNTSVLERFVKVLTAKLTCWGSSIIETRFCSETVEATAHAVQELKQAGCGLIVVIAGPIVNPDNLTRKGLVAAGLTDVSCGVPVTPGAMTLLGRIGDIRLLGVPESAFLHTTTSLDILLPRLLARIPIDRKDLAQLGSGGLCMECPSCSYPKCPFGR